MRHAAALSKIEFAGRSGWGRLPWRLAVAMAAILVLAGSLIVATERADAQSNTYLAEASDNGNVIKVRVTFTDDDGNDESLTSEGTATVVMGGL